MSSEATVARAVQGGAADAEPLLPFSRIEQAQVLVDAVRRLSLARTVTEIQEVVRVAARRLTGADGATFVLRDGGYCYYVDEDAISPLWKGQRFPIETCISGWAMLHRQPVVVEDIYADDRIPHDAYRPTFVKSLAMVPIRAAEPVGAIGNYWATRRRPTDGEVELLQALADSTAVAMENVHVWGELEERVGDRTAELQQRTRELEETNDSIRALYDEVRRSFEAMRERSEHHLEVLNTLAHEVRTPLVAGRMILRHAIATDGDGGGRLSDVEATISEALAVVTSQLDAARLEAGMLSVVPRDVDVAAELTTLARTCRALVRSDAVPLVVDVPEAPLAFRTDPVLLGHVLRNLVVNALKFTDEGEVRVGANALDGEVVFTVADTGIGIAAEDIATVFEQWRQVDGAQRDRPRGSGLGLPLVRRLVDALGGRIELESEPGRGSTFRVGLPREPR